MTAVDAKVIHQDNIPVDIGRPSVESTQRWFRAQVPYRNFAGFSEALDSEILSSVDTTKKTFQDRMMGVHQRWAANYATFNGEAQTQDRPDDVSMPETQKLLNSKVAHMERALFGIDPILEVEGTRDDLGPLKSVVVGAYVRRMLELARHRDYFGPAAKDAQLCNYSAIKVSWSKRFADIVNTEARLEYGKNGAPAYWHIEKAMSRTLVEDGPKLHLIDPFWLILDLDAGHIEDLSYIGDESEQFLHTFEEMAELGIYPKAQVKKLRDNRKSNQSPNDSTNGANLTDQFREARMIAMQGSSVGESTRAARGARRIRTIDLWMWFDFGDGYKGVTDPLGRKITGTQKVVITVADGVVLQFRLNPFDKKFFPYAVAVMNQTGHEMVAPAPFDQVVVMNSQYDRFMSIVLRNLDIGNTPFLALGPDADWSEPSLNNLQPGAIMRNVGNFEEVASKDLPQWVPFFIGNYRREMEECAGKLRVHESPVGTATEVERKLQEQQMLIDRETRIQAEQWRRICLIIYKMAGQFATQAQQFTVVGKMQSLLKKSFAIPPNWLQEEVDFRFIGVDSMHTVGSRAAGLSQWSNRWGPLLPQYPEINVPGLMRLDWEQSVGRHNMSMVFPDPEPPWMQWSQKEENELLRQGLAVPISKHDNHKQHLQELVPLMRELQRNPNSPAFVLDAVGEHIQEHLDAMQREAAEQEAKQRQAEQRQTLLGSGPGADRAAANGGLEAPTKQAGITPGPTQARTVARTGREGQGTSQTQQSEAK